MNLHLTKVVGFFALHYHPPILHFKLTFFSQHVDESDFESKSVNEVLQAALVEDQNDEEGVLTLRTWVIGVGFSIVGCGLNTLFTLRNPSISIAKSTAQLLAYPLGRLWDAAMPRRSFNLAGKTFSLNPHPFNQRVQ